MSKPTRREENKLLRQGIKLVAGVDEAGRGAWAGPLVAAAVILPAKCSVAGINDSKKLSARQRERVFKKIIASAIAWSVAMVSHQEIDRHGLGWANCHALINCVKRLSIKPDFILVDFFKVKYYPIPSRGIMKGDAKVLTIAAASIIAKVTRDRLMIEYHRKYPHYHFHQHKGYGTAEHRRRIIKHGLSPWHRRSFEPMKSLVNTT